MYLSVIHSVHVDHFLTLQQSMHAVKINPSVRKLWGLQNYDFQGKLQIFPYSPTRGTADVDIKPLSAGNPELSMVPIVRLGKGQNVVLHASSTAGNFYLPAPFNFIPSPPSPSIRLASNIKWRVSWTTGQTFTCDFVKLCITLCYDIHSWLGVTNFS